MTAADEARAALERALELDGRGQPVDTVANELAEAQVWATLAVAEAVKDGFASTLYTGKP